MILDLKENRIYSQQFKSADDFNNAVTLQDAYQCNRIATGALSGFSCAAESFQLN